MFTEPSIGVGLYYPKVMGFVKFGSGPKCCGMHKYTFTALEASLFIGYERFVSDQWSVTLHGRIDSYFPLIDVNPEVEYPWNFGMLGGILESANYGINNFGIAIGIYRKYSNRFKIGFEAGSAVGKYYMERPHKEDCYYNLCINMQWNLGPLIKGSQ